MYCLTSPDELVGFLAIAAWRIVAVVGVIILARWLPGGGKHAADSTDDNWAQGPSLSILGHVGIVLGVIFFTYTVLAGRVA